MAAPIISLRDGSDVIIPPSALAFPGVTPGAPSGALVVRIYNGFDGEDVDPAERLSMTAMARKTGTDVWLSTGLPALDHSSLEVRATGSTSGISAPPTGWVGLGLGEAFKLPSLPKGEGVFTELRLVLPAAANADPLEFAVEVQDLRAVWIGDEHPDRVVSGEDDSATLAMVSKDGEIEPSPVPDAFVLFPAVSWQRRGLWRANFAEVVEFDNLDGLGDPLAVGEAYYAAASLYDGLTITKAPKSTQPLVDDDKPAMPVGEVPWAWILVKEGLIVDVTEIDDIAVLGLFFAVPDGLGLRIGPGEANAGGWRANLTTATDVPLLPNVTSDVFLVGPDASFVVTTDGSRPDGRPLHLWTAVTDGAQVTILEDRRGVGVEVTGA